MEQCKTRKELAAEVGFDASNIGKDEKHGNIMAADTATKKKHYSVIQKLDAMPASTKNHIFRLITEWEND